MGWVWRDEADNGINEKDGDFNFSQSDGGVEFDITNPSSSDGGSERHFTRRVLRSQCHTEEVEPGKFIRKCEKTEEILRDCIGKPAEVLKSTKEYTEEDVSNQMVKGPFPSEKSQDGPFDFPGLRSDIENIERYFVFGGINRFLDAAEEMKNHFLDIFGSPHLYDDASSSRPSMRQGTPIEDHPQKETPPKDRDSGLIDLAGLAKDV